MGIRDRNDGDAIARLTGLSRSWIGLVLFATATSLPELFTGISAVRVADAPNIAVGDMLGSCVFNIESRQRTGARMRDGCIDIRQQPRPGRRPSKRLLCDPTCNRVIGADEGGEPSKMPGGLLG